VDARVEGLVDDFDRVVVIRVAPLAEHHRAQTQRADADSGPSEIAIAHSELLAGLKGRSLHPPRPRASTPPCDDLDPAGYSGCALEPVFFSRHVRSTSVIERTTPRSCSGHGMVIRPARDIVQNIPRRAASSGGALVVALLVDSHPISRG